MIVKNKTKQATEPKNKVKKRKEKKRKIDRKKERQIERYKERKKERKYLWFTHSLYAFPQDFTMLRSKRSDNMTAVTKIW